MRSKRGILRVTVMEKILIKIKMIVPNSSLICDDFKWKVQATYLVGVKKYCVPPTTVSKRGIVGVTRMETFFVMTLMSVLNKIFIA